MGFDEQGRRFVMAGHGCDEQGPFLLLNDRARGEQIRFDVRGKTFSLRRTATRRCIGRHDLETHEKTPCPLDVELPSTPARPRALHVRRRRGSTPRSTTPSSYRRSNEPTTKSPIRCTWRISPHPM